MQEPENEDIEREERIELNIIPILFIMKQFKKLNLSAKLMLTSETSMSKGEALSVWPFLTFHCKVFGPVAFCPLIGARLFTVAFSPFLGGRSLAICLLEGRISTRMELF